MSWQCSSMRNCGCQGTRRGLAHVNRSPKPGCRSNRNEFMALTLISIAQPRICRSWGFKDWAHDSACPKPQAMKDETPHCHRVQAAVKLTRPDVSQPEGWQGQERRRLTPTVKMLSMSSLVFSSLALCRKPCQDAEFRCEIQSNLPHGCSENHFMMYSVRSRPPKRRLRDAECNFRRRALCETRPSCVPERTECNLL